MTKLYEQIGKTLRENNIRFWAGDNISHVLAEGDVDILIDEATEAFEEVLDALLIDRDEDPNSEGTARRLAKMYYKELMYGRYHERPTATAFPNNGADRYSGMLVVR